jgi:hypothetical protein
MAARIVDALDADHNGQAFLLPGSWKEVLLTCWQAVLRLRRWLLTRAKRREDYREDCPKFQRWVIRWWIGHMPINHRGSRPATTTSSGSSAVPACGEDAYRLDGISFEVASSHILDVHKLEDIVDESGLRLWLGLV